MMNHQSQLSRAGRRITKNRRLLFFIEGSKQKHNFARFWATNWISNCFLPILNEVITQLPGKDKPKQSQPDLITFTICNFGKTMIIRATIEDRGEDIKDIEYRTGQQSKTSSTSNQFVCGLGNNLFRKDALTRKTKIFLAQNTFLFIFSWSMSQPVSKSERFLPPRSPSPLTPPKHTQSNK